MASQMKFLIALALVACVICSVTVSGQDYDDEGGREQNDGYGGFGGGGDDDYAAPRDRGVVGAEGSDINPQGYHHQGDDSGNDNYDSDDVAAAASKVHPTLARPTLAKLIKRQR